MSDKVDGVLTADMIYRVMENLMTPRCLICGGCVELGMPAHNECVERERAQMAELAAQIEQLLGRPLN